MVENTAAVGHTQEQGKCGIERRAPGIGGGEDQDAVAAVGSIGRGSVVWCDGKIHSLRIHA